MRILGVLFALLMIFIVIITIAFAALNATSVEINYLIGSKTIPLPVILLIALSTGILLSFFLLGFTILKVKAKNKWLEGKLKKKQAHIQH